MIAGKLGTKLSMPFTILQSQRNNGIEKYGHLMLPGSFQDKVTPDIDFADEAEIQYNVPVVKKIFVGDCDLQLNKFRCEYLRYCFWRSIFVYLV